LKILISAAETSSDAHGAELLRALRAEGGEVQAFGVGGPKLQDAGLRAVVDAREMLAMGFLEVIGRLPRILRSLRTVTEAAAAERPDVAVVIDYPDFHFRLARRLKTLGIPVVYYIPPKVWVWRKKRMRVLRDSFARVLSILPFEVPFYEQEHVPVKYVGNPLVDELPLRLTREDARARIGLDEGQKVLVLMPGSRPSEIKRHVELLLDAATRAAAVLRSKNVLHDPERLIVLMPFPVTSELAQVRDQVDAWLRRSSGRVPGFILDVRVSQGDAPECLVAADAGLIKSGTSTLEAALLGCPHGIVYKPNWLTAWAFKHLVRYKGPVGLSNLVAGWSPERPLLVHEILCGDASVSSLSEEMVSLLSDPLRARELREGFLILREKILGGALGSHISPSTLAAREVLAVVRESRP
jgi:lipid-A-disaccharide synthase